MFKAYNHNGTLIAEADKATDIFKMAKEYHDQTGNAYFIEEDKEDEVKTYSYWLIEKTTIYHEVKASSKDEADEKVQSFIDSGYVDWGNGDMETNYEFNGEITNA
jgi:hypothetical protein